MYSNESSMEGVVLRAINTVVAEGYARGAKTDYTLERGEKLLRFYTSASGKGTEALAQALADLV